MWAREYRVDGFRFDLMGHHSKANMLAIRAALDELTLKKDGVDGTKIYLYGEGWNFGEVADDKLFEQATPGQPRRHRHRHVQRPAARRRARRQPGRRDSTYEQGFGTGLATDPNGKGADGTPEQALAKLGSQTDLVKLGLAGNLRDYRARPRRTEPSKPATRSTTTGRRRATPTSPTRSINYVDAHDNETLYDIGGAEAADRHVDGRSGAHEHAVARDRRARAVAVVLARGHRAAALEVARRNSYNSGDWFNRIDWTGQESTFGSGLPRAADNEDKWSVIGAAAGEPRAQAAGIRHRVGRGIRPRAAAGARARWICCASARRTSSSRR